MRGQVEQDGAQAAPAELLGECAHEGRLAGPAVHQQHACRGGAVGLEDVGLQVAGAGGDTQLLGMAQMEARPGHELIVIGAAVARQARGAEPLVGEIAPSLGRVRAYIRGEIVKDLVTLQHVEGSIGSCGSCVAYVRCVAVMCCRSQSWLPGQTDAAVT